MVSSSGSFTACFNSDPTAVPSPNLLPPPVINTASIGHLNIYNSFLSFWRETLKLNHLGLPHSPRLGPGTEKVCSIDGVKLACITHAEQKGCSQELKS